jgi:hypothetical protein
MVFALFGRGGFGRGCAIPIFFPKVDMLRYGVYISSIIYFVKMV